MVLCFWLFRLPFARFLALDLHMNTTGCWIAMAASTFLSGILTAVIHTRTGALAERAVEAMTRALAAPPSAPPGQILVPFDLYIAENI